MEKCVYFLLAFHSLSLLLAPFFVSFSCLPFIHFSIAKNMPCFHQFLHSTGGLNNWERNHILSLLCWLYSSTKNYCFIVFEMTFLKFSVALYCHSQLFKPSGECSIVSIIYKDAHKYIEQLGFYLEKMDHFPQLKLYNKKNNMHIFSQGGSIFSLILAKIEKRK